MSSEDETPTIQQLIEAARADERAKLETQNILAGIHQRLTALEESHRKVAQEIEWLRGVVQGTYNNVATLVRLMAALWQDDRMTLAEMRQRIVDQTFSREGGGADISVRAEGDVKLSADRIGGDKSESEN
jgi:hypothetical protein